jgi:DNA-binding transcriptional ArsR family regulator
MPATPPISEIAALVANPGRANMLATLLDGQALSAGDLAFAAHVTPQTASGHLARMTAARLLIVERSGRHAWYRLASPLVGRMIEAMMAVAAETPERRRPWRGEEALRNARTCYDHLAGRLGVALTDALRARGCIVLGDDGGVVTAAGRDLLADFGIDLETAGARRRVYCRPCLDWSERRPHLAGFVGAAVASRCFELGWVRRLPDTRALAIAPEGRRGFAERFGVEGF